MIPALFLTLLVAVIGVLLILSVVPLTPMVFGAVVILLCVAIVVHHYDRWWHGPTA